MAHEIERIITFFIESIVRRHILLHDRYLKAYIYLELFVRATIENSLVIRHCLGEKVWRFVGGKESQNCAG